ncbi:CDP-glycerol glycerophosphotransferase family protein [Priestia taiwanensis]|uniref:CDP-glycerol:poly(Glycerophosphate) glycerophosphotransferase n=1 Tax=Priestia taiwanensis TaxID=1347902 RepID=A0A917AYK4_9BACI|nr:CDP-glycerol glycerophosphotransferase family protein [Priestia taiwanensis]MBM7364386.1 hypothetical protein [Priestia taiwanensis]GGE81784.1 hypothetical protein GCM10007140_34330 [Priestia taiwanensis]
MNNSNVVGFYIETSFHYYLYETIIDSLLEEGVQCHIVINDEMGKQSEFSHMYNDMISFIEDIDRSDIDAYTMSTVKDAGFKYDCLVSPYLAKDLRGIAKKHVRVMYSLAKEKWIYGWWNIVYDRILNYGQYDYSKLNIDNNCVIIGNPKFDKWFKNDISNLKSIEKALDLDRNKKTIMYAPTYGDLSSIDSWIEKINMLQEHYNVLIKLHHGTAFKESEQYRRDYLNLHFKNISVSTEDLFPFLKIADYVVTDNSGMIFDAILAGKDILLLNTTSSSELTDERSLEQKARSQIININMTEDIKEVLENDNLFTLQKARINTLQKELYTYLDGDCGKRAADEIIKVIDDNCSDENRLLTSLREVVFGKK